MISIDIFSVQELVEIDRSQRLCVQKWSKVFECWLIKWLKTTRGQGNMLDCRRVGSILSGEVVDWLMRFPCDAVLRANMFLFWGA